MPTPNELIETLIQCPPGMPGWTQFEDACTNVLTYLFVPPLETPTIQARTESGIDIRDAIFPNRNNDGTTLWGQLRRDHNARMILFEFKNYDTSDIGSDEVDQLRNYMNDPMGSLAFLTCSKEPHRNAVLRRNQVYRREEKVIIFLDSNQLVEMVNMRERGDDPASFIMEQVELFYIQHE